MRISDRVKRLTPPLTPQLIAKTKALQAAGKDVISLGAGEPDFRTPEDVCRAAVKAMDAGHTRYTEVAGILDLRKAIVALYAKPWGLTYKPSQASVWSMSCRSLFPQRLSRPEPHASMPPKSKLLRQTE